MRRIKNTIYIQVNPNFEYDADVMSIGKSSDLAGSFSMYGWIAHLRDKNWWSEDKERSFKKLANEIYEMV